MRMVKFKIVLHAAALLLKYHTKDQVILHLFASINKSMALLYKKLRNKSNKKLKI